MVRPTIHAGATCHHPWHNRETGAAWHGGPAVMQLLSDCPFTPEWAL